jgi:signal transduction histidine kinase
MPESLKRFHASRLFDPALAVALTAVCLIELSARSNLTSSPRAPVAIAVIGAAVAVRRAHPVVAASIQGVAFLATPDFDNHFLPDTVLAPVAVVAYSLGAHVSRRSGLIVVAGLLAALQTGAGFEDFPNVELAFVTLGPWWVGTQVRDRRRLVDTLGRRNRELEAEEDAFARLSIRRERARIARELHDVVSHHLAVIVVQAGAGRMAAKNDGAAERFAAIRDSGGQALAEMARLVDVLQADSGEGHPALGELSLLIDAAKGRGVDLHFTPPPTHLTLSPEVQETAYRVVQEGLTNAMKHAPGSEVHVRLSVLEDEIQIEVRDTGATSGADLAGAGSGLGLTGMRERVEALGGRLEAGPERDAGWRVCAHAPLAAAPVIPSR